MPRSGQISLHRCTSVLMCHSAAFPDSWHGADALLYLQKGLHDVVAGLHTWIPSAPGAVPQSAHRPWPHKGCM